MPKLILTPALITVERMLAAFDRMDYHVSGGSVGGERPYDLNFFAVRADTGLRVTNRFDDVLGCLYRGGDKRWRVEAWWGTTDPGLDAHLKPSNPDGTGIVVPGQYRGMWARGKHKGKYPAFVQVGPVKVYRDADRNRTIDTLSVPLQTGVFGINQHRASANMVSVVVGNWSHACFVHAANETLQRALWLGGEQERRGYGRTFTNTLFLQREVLG